MSTSGQERIITSSGKTYFVYSPHSNVPGFEVTFNPNREKDLSVFIPHNPVAFLAINELGVEDWVALYSRFFINPLLTILLKDETQKSKPPVIGPSQVSQQIFNPLSLAKLGGNRLKYLKVVVADHDPSQVSDSFPQIWQDMLGKLFDATNPEPRVLAMCLVLWSVEYSIGRLGESLITTLESQILLMLIHGKYMRSKTTQGVRNFHNDAETKLILRKVK